MDVPPPAAGRRDVPADRAAYATLTEGLSRFLDAFAAANPDAATAAALSARLAAWTDALAAIEAPAGAQMFGRLPDLPGHGQTMCPAVAVERQDAAEVVGTVRFGRYFVGANNAAHGGAVALMFDRLLGLQAHAGGGPMARTAYLHVDYRAVTPIDAPLTAAARIVSVDGRKRLLRGTLHHGERLCAEAEGLFIELRPGQP